MVANPANTNALILKENAPKIPNENITCLTRLDHNRALGQIAERAKVPVTDVKNVTIWGNHSSSQYPDVNHGTVKGKPIREVIKDDDYLNKEFIETVQQRGAAIIKVWAQTTYIEPVKGKEVASTCTHCLCRTVHCLPSLMYTSAAVRASPSSCTGSAVFSLAYCLSNTQQPSFSYLAALHSLCFCMRGCIVWLHVSGNVMFHRVLSTVELEAPLHVVPQDRYSFVELTVMLHQDFTPMLPLVRILSTQSLLIHIVNLNLSVFFFQARNLSSAMSAASSACDHIYNWVNGTPKDSWVSMGVYSDGSYNAPKVLLQQPNPCFDFAPLTA